MEARMDDIARIMKAADFAARKHTTSAAKVMRPSPT